MKIELKSLCRVLARHVRVRIRSGPAQGLLWSLPTRARFIRGVYEEEMAGFVTASLTPQDVFWDVGAHFGYYTLIASRAVAVRHCYAFEPDPGNLWYLRHHLQWNDVVNATVFPIALGKDDGTRVFGGGHGTGSGKLDCGGLRVEVRSVDSLIQASDCAAPTFMKIDVQGAEAETLEGARSLLKEVRPTLCLSTHGLEPHLQCRQILVSHGYQLHDFPLKKLIIAVGAGRDIPDFLLSRIPDRVRAASVE